MTMQRPIISDVSNNDLDLPASTSSAGMASNSLGTLSTAAGANTIALSTTTALELLSSTTNKNGPQHLSTTSLSRNGSLGSSHRSSSGTGVACIQSVSPHALWGQSSTPSSIPLLSPAELAADGKHDSSNKDDDPIQALLLAQVRYRLQQDQGQNSEPHMQPTKRPRIMLMDSSASESPSNILESLNPFLAGGVTHTLSASGQGLVGGIPPAMLRNTSDPIKIPTNGSGIGGLSNLLSSSAGDSLPISGVNANGSKISQQLQQLLRKQQLHELQHLQQLKQREDMQRLSQLQSKDAVIQLMLQQQQQSLSVGNSNALEAQLKALHQNQINIDEATVSKYMRRHSQNNSSSNNNMKSQQNKLLLQMQALAKSQQPGQQDDDEGDGGMPPPPPMVSAVSSLDSVAVMSMLLPSNQQNQKQPQQQSPSNKAISKFLGNELALGEGGFGTGTNLNPSLVTPISYPQQALGNLGMNPSFLGGLSGNSALSNMIGRGSGTVMCQPSPGINIHPSAAEVIYEQRRLAAATEVSNTVRDSSVGKPPDAFIDRDPDGRARDLPTLLVVPMDHMQLSSHQTLLRYQIEVFRAGEEDTSTHTRGRNKPVQLGQIGIRCRHCKVLPVSRRKRGSVYFPRAVEGFYQAAQNMNSTHLQTGECPLMGNALRQEFANLIATRGVSTGAGRAYWAKQARKLGLRNTESGIVFDKRGPDGERRVGNEKSNITPTEKDKNFVI